MVEAILPSSWYYLHLPLNILIPLSLLLMSFSWGQLWSVLWPIINIIKVWYRQISKKPWKKRFTNTWELLQKWDSQPSWCILGKGFVGGGKGYGGDAHYHCTASFMCDVKVGKKALKGQEKEPYILGGMVLGVF